jgi:hypothetical protein
MSGDGPIGVFDVLWSSGLGYGVTISVEVPNHELASTLARKARAEAAFAAVRQVLEAAGRAWEAK